MLQFLRISFLLAACCCFLDLAAQAPPNDNCADAIAIDTGTYAFTTVNANTDGPGHPNDCASSGSTPDSCYNDVWYLFTADFTGLAEFSTCATANFDSKIIVYNAGVACPPGANDVLACNEDGSASCIGFTSETIFAVESGKTYLLRLGGWGDGSPGEEGEGTFFVKQKILAGPPNDLCANFISLDMGAEDSITVSYSTIDALDDGPQHFDQSCFDPPGETEVFKNIWYRFTPNFTGWVEWTNCNTANYDSRVAVYQSTACPPDPFSLVGCSDDGIDALGENCGGFTSRTIFPVESGVTYTLSVGGWSAGDSGDGAFQLKKAEMPDFPANDNCASPDSAWVITKEEADGFEVIHEGNTLYATWDDTQTRPTCRPTGEHWDVWYEFNSGFNTELELRFNKTGNSNNQFVIDMYSACGEADTTTSYCIRTDAFTSTFVVDTITGFPGTPTWYLLRVTTRVTGNTPGPFWIQLVGTPLSGVGDEPTIGNFRFAPNPANHQARVDFDLNEASADSFWSILSPLGQVVSMENSGRLEAGKHQLNLPLDDLARGIYFFRLSLEGGEKTVRFVKN